MSSRIGDKKKNGSEKDNPSMERFIGEMSDKNVSKDYVRVMCRSHENIFVYARLFSSECCLSSSSDMTSTIPGIRTLMKSK